MRPSVQRQAPRPRKAAASGVPRADDSVQGFRYSKRFVELDVAFEPVADAVALPDQDVTRQARAVLDDEAVLVEQEQEVRLAAQEDAR